MRLVLLPLFLAAFGLAGCEHKAAAPAAAALDQRSLAKEEMDPILALALEGPIMVDPGLRDLANRDVVKPADTPATLPIPPAPLPSTARSRQTTR